MTNFELVKQMYYDLASGNAPAALALFDPAIEWRECQGMPFVEDDGVYVGTNTSTRNPFKANATHIWTVKNGKMIRFFQAVDTAAFNS